MSELVETRNSFRNPPESEMQQTAHNTIGFSQELFVQHPLGFLLLRAFGGFRCPPSLHVWQRGLSDHFAELRGDVYECHLAGVDSVSYKSPSASTTLLPCKWARDRKEPVEQGATRCRALHVVNEGLASATSQRAHNDFHIQPPINMTMLNTVTYHGDLVVALSPAHRTYAGH